MILGPIILIPGPLVPVYLTFFRAWAKIHARCLFTWISLAIYFFSFEKYAIPLWAAGHIHFLCSIALYHQIFQIVRCNSISSTDPCSKSFSGLISNTFSSFSLPNFDGGVQNKVLFLEWSNFSKINNKIGQGLKRWSNSARKSITFLVSLALGALNIEEKLTGPKLCWPKA